MTRSLYSTRTASRPVGDGWRRVPSVTYGGAPSFWHRRTPDALEWFAYNRELREWITTREELSAAR